MFKQLYNSHNLPQPSWKPQFYLRTFMYNITILY